MATVLIVEDEVTVADLLTAALTTAGYQAVAVYHGGHAVDRLARFPHPQLVVTDLMMPVMGGSQLISLMESHQLQRLIPVIIMSSMPESHVRQHVAERVPFIQKPFQLAAMFALVARTIASPAT